MQQKAQGTTTQNGRAMALPEASPVSAKGDKEASGNANRLYGHSNVVVPCAFHCRLSRMPPFQLSAICFAIGSIPGIVVLALNPSRLALLPAAGQGLDRRDCRPVRVPLPLFHSTSKRAGRRSRADRLSLAVADRVLIGVASGRAFALCTTSWAPSPAFAAPS